MTGFLKIFLVMMAGTGFCGPLGEDAMPSATSPADLFFGSDGLKADLNVLQAEALKPNAYLRPGGVQVAVRQWKVPKQVEAAFPGGIVAAYALDLDVDGKADWLAVEQGSQRMRVVRSDGSMGSVQEHRADPCPCTRSFADLDGDGWVEMLVDCNRVQRWSLWKLDAHLNFHEAFRFRPGFVKDGSPAALPGLPLGAPLLSGQGKKRSVLGLAQSNDFSEDAQDFAAEALPTLYFRSASQGEALERLQGSKRAVPLSLAQLAGSRDAMRWKEGLTHPLEQRPLLEADKGYGLDLVLVQMGSDSDPWPDPPMEGLVVRKDGKEAWHAPLDPGSPCCRSALVRRGFVSPDGSAAALVLDGPEGLTLRSYSAQGLAAEHAADPCVMEERGSLRWSGSAVSVLCGQAGGIPMPKGAQ